jgi:hypothetical protein
VTSENADRAQLVAAGRRALRPSSADRARVREALRARLELAGPSLKSDGLTPEQAAPPQVAGIGWPKLLLTGTGIAVIAAAVALSIGKQVKTAAVETRSDTHSASVSVALPSVLDGPRPAVDVQTQPAVQGTLSQNSIAPVTTMRSNKDDLDTLSKEIALLARAEKDFHSGNFAHALRQVEEYRRRFPKGALEAERRRLRIQILCRLGRISEAEAEQGRLSRGARGSKTGDVCGAVP